MLLVFYREPAWRQSKSRRTRELRPIIFKTRLRFQAAFKAWRCVYGVTWLSRLSRVRYSCSSKRSGSGETQLFLSFFPRPFLAREKPMTLDYRRANQTRQRLSRKVIESSSLHRRHFDERAEVMRSVVVFDLLLRGKNPRRIMAEPSLLTELLLIRKRDVPPVIFRVVFRFFSFLSKILLRLFVAWFYE